jgi:DNA-binding NarL/FixJ family response regulator
MPLTPREQEVLELASHGLSYAEIAEELVLTAATVKTHFAHIYCKLQVPDKAAAVAWALRHGLIS